MEATWDSTGIQNNTGNELLKNKHGKIKQELGISIII
jgi:hypothetical protein